MNDTPTPSTSGVSRPKRLTAIQAQQLFLQLMDDDSDLSQLSDDDDEFRGYDRPGEDRSASDSSDSSDESLCPLFLLFFCDKTLK